eukprot:TRINITY_DN6259_c0_g1_i11.p1 TRINITY_DN6259_c0_g1~~TRINITY_DN6259_c0_g1_i11.p1  ORF type:complete len:306 (+),score=87.81 TRINITY_DN6259_c0_g1_i11:828-1745(+)
MIVLVLVTRMKCNSIFKQLQYTVDDSEQLSETFEDEEKKLSEIVVDYPIPKYIRNKAEMKCAWCQRSNRQEALFPCGKFGISLMVFEFQVVLSSSLLGLIALVWYELVDIYKYGHWAVYILLAVGIVLYFYLLLHAIPLSVRRFMLVTSIEMMKDYKIVNKVIKRKQIETSRLLFRVYKVFKLILFEQLKMKGVTIEGEVSPILSREYLASFIEELNQKQTISIDEISQLAHAWGNDYVTSLEAYLFLKKSGATLENDISLDDIECYLRFELKYGHNKAGENVLRVFSFLFPGCGYGKLPTKTFV